MICPKCKKEYSEEVGHCPTCDVSPVTTLAPQKTRATATMLPQAAELAMVSMIFIFLSRTVATFAPDLFRNIVLAGTNLALMMLSDLALLFFFIRLYREYLPDKAEGLRTAAILVMIVLAAGAGLRLMGLLIMFGVTMPNLIGDMFFGSVDWMSILPFVNSLMLFIFFVVFRLELGGDISRKMLLATHLAIAGAAISMLVFALGLMGYISDSMQSYLQKSFVYLRVIVLPLTGFATFAYIYFMSRFRQSPEH